MIMWLLNSYAIAKPALKTIQYLIPIDNVIMLLWRRDLTTDLISFTGLNIIHRNVTY